MKHPRSWLLILLILVVVGWATQGWAQSETPDKDSAGTPKPVPVANGTVAISPVEAKDFKQLWEQPEYQLTLHNNANTGQIQITSIAVEFLQSSLHDALSLGTDQMTIELPSSRSIDSETDLDSTVKIRLPAPRHNWAWLAFTPDHYDLKVIVRYSSVSDRDQREYKSEARFKVPLAPDFWAIATGAVAGCFVLVVTLRVIGTYKFVEELNKRQGGANLPTAVSFKQLLPLMPLRVLESVLLFCAGSVAACVALGVAAVTNDARIIMSLQVHDAMGGFTLGFLSIPLIDVVRRFAQGQLDKPANPSPADPAPPPPNPV